MFPGGALLATASSSFRKRLARLSNRGAYPVHTFPSSMGDRKGIGHARGPDPFGMVRHSPSVFASHLPTGNAATDYFSPHSRISFQRHSSAVSPPRMAVSCSSLNVTRSTATLARYLDEAWLRAPGDLADEF